MTRADALTQLAIHVNAIESGHPLRVAVDGITASGKTTLADELGQCLEKLGRSAIRLSMDGFHNPRAIRYRQGRRSPREYYEDAYDFASLAEHVLLPLGPNGNGRYRNAVIDLATDTAVDESALQAHQDAVVIVDGTFLQRPQIADLWDVRIFVDTSFDVARRRGVVRDAELLGGEDEADRAFRVRYHAASQMYLDDVGPAGSADIVFDNDDLSRPSLYFGSLRASRLREAKSQPAEDE